MPMAARIQELLTWDTVVQESPRFAEQSAETDSKKDSRYVTILASPLGAFPVHLSLQDTAVTPYLIVKEQAALFPAAET